MKRNITRDVPANDLALLNRVLEFANLKVIESQGQVYSWFADLAYVPKRRNADGSVTPLIQRLKPEDGVGPFINDQRAVKQALTDIARHDPKAIEALQIEASKVLGETLKAELRMGWEGKKFRLVGHPYLTDIRAILWYAVVLIFHHDLERLLKICKAELDSGPCNNFFLFTPRLRRYCCDDHAEKGKKDAVLAAIKNWRKAHEGENWGVTSRRKNKRAQPKKRRKR